MKVALCDDTSLGFWTDSRHLFHSLVDPLRSRGHDPILIDAPACGLPRLTTAFARERDALPLLSSTRIAHRLIAEGADLCLFRESTGLAHATLMARACGELPAATRIVLWRDGDDTSPKQASDGEGCNWASHGMQSVVIAAMRRFCAEASDDLISTEDLAPADAGYGRGEAFGATLLLRDFNAPIRDFVFCGPLNRSAGLVAFVEAVEALSRLDPASVGAVTFVGAFDQVGGAGVDCEWLGRRASAWSFRFSVENTCSLSHAAAQASCRGRITVAVGVGADFVDRLSPAGRARTVVRQLTRQERHNPSRLCDLLTVTGPNDQKSMSDETVAAALLAKDYGPAFSFAASAMVGLSFCILHHERPKLLTKALASILSQATEAMPLEIVIVDNASTSKTAVEALQEAASDQRVEVVRLSAPRPYSSALNVAAERARLPFLVFLDDDNLLAPGGLARLARACAGGCFDVVTSALDVFEEVSTDIATRMTFIGPAHTAGLFANAFGDNCMAFRRKAFARIGGYLQRDGAYPSADWILLCRAQAAGLRIGVLQEPAFLYRRSLHKADMHWQPWDQQIVRVLLLESYGECFDTLEVARLAQAMALELCV